MPNNILAYYMDFLLYGLLEIVPILGSKDCK